MPNSIHKTKVANTVNHGIISILCIGPVARYRYKMNYFTLMGMIAGTYTDPPALAYANQTAGNDAPALTDQKQDTTL